MGQDGVAALPQGGLGAEVGDDAHQAVAQPGDGQPRGDALHQGQGADIPPHVVHQLPCIHATNM